MFVVMMCVATVWANDDQRTTVASPDGRNVVVVDWANKELTWSLQRDDEVLILPSRIALATNEGVWGSKIRSAKVFRSSMDRLIESPLYRQSHVRDHHNIIVIEFNSREGDFALEVRAFNDGVAYRFLSLQSKRYWVIDEFAEFAVAENSKVWIPYVNAKADATSDYNTQFYTSFENTYDYVAVEDIDPRRLAFAPILVECDGGTKLCITESDLESYPGMFFSNGDGNSVIDTEFAPVPDIVEQGGHNMLQGEVKSRKAYIAECNGRRAFPWRVVAVAEKDTDLVNSDIVWRLASSCRVEDTSWIKPGKVAWEWWNHWGVYGVPFRAGVNNETYKYYIDFASEMGIEYVILDEGWSVTGRADLMQVVPEIDLRMLVDYGRERGVGIILWAGYWALNRDIETLCKYFSEMGVKGFKVDFMDRDDQPMVEFYYDVARIAAEYKLLVDFHGAYKPTGLSRTYPNVVNYEGVHGLEQMKWSPASVDQITYDVTIPFIRGVAGPMDYTQGAMRNAAVGSYHPSNTEPMSQGTRCHQLAMYVVYDSPLNMLCDSPSAYLKEEECARFIAEIPTVWDETKCLSGEVGSYVEVLRRKGNIVYIAGLNGHEERMMSLGHLVSPYGNSVESIEIFRDGPNADLFGQDYLHETFTREELPSLWQTWMSRGGGYVVKIVLK